MDVFTLPTSSTTSTVSAEDNSCELEGAEEFDGADALISEK